MFFEELTEFFVGQHIADRGANAGGVLDVATAEFGVNCLADILQAIERHKILEDRVSVAAVFCEVVFHRAVHSYGVFLSVVN